MVSRLISATRHSKRNSSRIATTSRKPSTSDWVRLWIEVWMKSACWKILVSKVIPGSPGWSIRTTCSTPWVTFTVSAQGSFSTTSIRPVLSPTMASPMSGWWSSFTSATWLSGTGVPSSFGTVTRARSAGVTTGMTWRMLID
jgi:hypothetical protein